MDGQGILEFMLQSLHCPALISTMSPWGFRPMQLETRLKPKFTDGMDGWMDGWNGVSKVSFNFVYTCTYIEHVYMYLYRS